MDDNNIVPTFKDPKEYLVVQSNILTRTARTNFSLFQQKLILLIFSKIKPTDTVLRYRFYVAEIYQLMDKENISGSQYKHLKKAIKKIEMGELWINNGTCEVPIKIFHRVDIRNDRSGLITVEIHPQLYPHLTKNKVDFTEFQLLNVINLKSKYSIQLYQYFKSYDHMFNKNKQYSLTVKIETLKNRLNIEKKSTYAKYTDLKRHLLIDCIEEINENTDIRVFCKAHKTGRRVTHLIFNIRKITDHNNYEAKKSKIAEQCKFNAHKINAQKDHAHTIYKNQRTMQEKTSFYDDELVDAPF